MPYAAVNGTRLYYEQSGSGEPLILIPGLGLDHTYYAHGVPALSQSMQTIAIDPRGVGKSDKADTEHSVETWADDVAALIEHLGHASAHVLGTSLGGTIALSLAIRHPERVRSLIVVGAFSELSASVELNYSLRKRLIAKIGMCEEMADFISLWIMTPPFLESERGSVIASDLRAGISRNDPARYTAFLDAILRLGRRQTPSDVPALTKALGAITAPTLVACADNDHFIPSGLSRIIHAGIPGARHVEIPGGGHIPFIEAPHLITQAVAEFVAAVPAVAS
jgi:pimeloyl-ACP methyl ester carboxylesterase